MRFQRCVFWACHWRWVRHCAFERYEIWRMNIAATTTLLVKGMYGLSLTGINCHSTYSILLRVNISTVSFRFTILQSFASFFFSFYWRRAWCVFLARWTEARFLRHFFFFLGTLFVRLKRWFCFVGAYLGWERCVISHRIRCFSGFSFTDTTTRSRQQSERRLLLLILLRSQGKTLTLESRHICKLTVGN